MGPVTSIANDGPVAHVVQQRLYNILVGMATEADLKAIQVHGRPQPVCGDGALVGWAVGARVLWVGWGVAQVADMAVAALEAVARSAVEQPADFGGC